MSSNYRKRDNSIPHDLARFSVPAALVLLTLGARRIKGLLPEGTPVAHKTGTSGTAHGLTRATNDVGVIQLARRRHLLLAVFVADSTASEPAREGAIARIARAAWDCWNTV